MFRESEYLDFYTSCIIFMIYSSKKRNLKLRLQIIGQKVGILVISIKILKMTFFDQISDTLIETMMYHSELDYMEYHLSEITKITMEKCEKCSKLVFYPKYCKFRYSPSIWEFFSTFHLRWFYRTLKCQNEYITERNIFKYEITAE